MFKSDDSGVGEDLGASQQGPNRPRNSWFIYITKCDTYDLVLGYKTGKGKTREFSQSPTNATVKIPFGTPIDCNVEINVNAAGDRSKIFHFRNRHGAVDKLNFNILNTLQPGS